LGVRLEKAFFKTSGLWTELAGQPNTVQVLEKKVLFLAPLIADSAYRAAKATMESAASLPIDVDRGKEQDLFLELTFCLVLSANTRARANWDEDSTDRFFGALVARILVLLSTSREFRGPEFRADFTRRLSERASEYGQWKPVPADGKGLKRTSVWEVGKRIAALIARNPRDVAVAAFCGEMVSRHVLTFVELLDDLDFFGGGV
jgi:hypothetical protein